MAILMKLRTRTPDDSGACRATRGLAETHAPVADLEATVNHTRATIAALEAESAQLGSTLAEDQIGVMLGDDPTAAARVTAGRRRQTAIEQERIEFI